MILFSLQPVAYIPLASVYVQLLILALPLPLLLKQRLRSKARGHLMIVLQMMPANRRWVGERLDAV